MSIRRISYTNTFSLILWLLLFPNILLAEDSFFSDDVEVLTVTGEKKPKKTFDTPPEVNEAPLYIIGPQDALQIFVWGHPDLSTGAAVRPDGRITLPLAEDIPVTNRTPTQLARELEKILGKYVRDPIVTVIVSGILGPYERQVRVLGEATSPQALPFIEGMTLLDLMIKVGGLTDFADGNGAKLFRIEEGQQKEFKARLEDLVRDADMSANVDLLPGDILLIPESWF